MKAVQSLQQVNRLVPDGRVGPKTRAVLGLKPNPIATPAAPSGAAPWMDIAVAELGVHEDSLPGKHNARILEYHRATSLKATTDETPWCSSFVNWVMKQAGY